ncbi:hypothetical protein WS86_06895 [Burkholderia savannae]|uniref:4-fold beta flower protein n=1 Tax=Burkholderia savannae TaxID=1637837 RepID=UPI00075C4E8D|nr:hypothetical protein [Burkholderia savannae]AOJ80374.1 hypothetical protein WS86_06895 [Burkholderia savannae]
MKVLIAEQFNQAMQQLRKEEQSEVASMFALVSKMERESLMSSPMLIRLQSDSSLYTLRTQYTRIFCSFVGDDLVLLDVKSANKGALGPSAYTQESKKGETTLFGSVGDPQAYIAPDAIYSFEGRPLAYLDGTNIYGFNGRHLGWFEQGVIWDHRGERVGFTKSACPVFTKFEEPIRSFVCEA